MLNINTQFDGGSISVLEAHDPTRIRLALRPDIGMHGAAEFKQWFYFRVQSAADKTLQIQIENADQASYPNGWSDYQAVASHDRLTWFRVPTEYVDGQLIIRYQPRITAALATTWLAYFEPYSWERHLNLLGWAQAQADTLVQDLGLTVQGRPLSLVQLGTPAAHKKKVWIIARQHPGETMAQWCVEGLLERLLEGEDVLAQRARDECVWYVVPNMNPDGAYLGNLRSNAAGVNLNREWLNPSLERSPEVRYVRDKIAATGVDLFLDIHGDEGLPYVFIEGGESLPSFSAKQRSMQSIFVASLLSSSADFQVEHGYPSGAESKTNLSLAAKYIGHTYGCLAMTLEMPFKDNANLPNLQTGWNGARSKHLGAALLPPIRAALELPE